MPPAFLQSDSVIVFVTSWAKAGQVNAIAVDNVQIETSIFIAVLLRVRAALAPFYALLCRCSIVLLAGRSLSVRRGADCSRPDSQMLTSMRRPTSVIGCKTDMARACHDVRL